MKNNIINKLKYCLNKKKNITIGYVEAMYLLDILQESNIIDELEKWLNEYIPLLEAGDICEETTQDTLKEVLDKLNELKGDNK